MIDTHSDKALDYVVIHIKKVPYITHFLQRGSLARIIIQTTIFNSRSPENSMQKRTL